jgi:hypothetical protein
MSVKFPAAFEREGFTTWAMAEPIPAITNHDTHRLGQQQRRINMHCTTRPSGRSQ